LVYGGYEIIVKVAAETAEDLKKVINSIARAIKSIIVLLCVQR
jgi:hypothetical protein